ncbi:hypothetical protein [Helicobacter canadensis]|uniref:Uncharacterized protein n=1 Tax=Helicobacter canadensis MIT 98-5491 TaxID=537970 RepID=C5ZVY7_9HELI|nr:hypothetical protein [Helicobacter canadensis]EES89068.1 conserved hypothetical protein [Helicobacter canadensis MIT 98-5491]EFR47845.1 hypothetical protein HCMG_00018 [Helicobacter canadensis MIT 98-5491]STO99098.1 Uncharacterised protein [Helicobacter canadensis]
MRKITLQNTLFSSLFFILTIFTLLTLLLSGIVWDFRQMFRLVTQPYGVYYCVGITFLACGIIISLFHIARIYSSHLPKFYSATILIALCLFVWLLYYEFFELKRFTYDIFSLEDSLKFTKEDIFKKNSYQLYLDYGIYCFFIIFPFVVYFFQLNFDKSTKIGRILQLTQPNLNTIIIALFGFTVTPFFKNGVLGYIDLVLMLAGLAMVMFLCWKRKYLVGSYEFFNLLLLWIVCLIMLFISHTFVDGESYFEVRKAFYFLMLFGWCNNWMTKLTTKIPA